MIDLKSVTKRVSSLESVVPQEESRFTTGSPGSASKEESRSSRLLVAAGKSEPIGAIGSPLETVIGFDQRVRILDTELSPWRMICALRMRAPNGAAAIGTGWFVGPRTIVTAGHCVHSTQFFAGWADTIEVIPGLIGAGPVATMRPFGSIASGRFSSVDRWIDQADPDFDIGCIHLDEPLGDTVGWFAIGTLSVDELTGFLVNISGYPGDRGNGNEQYHAVNRVLQLSDRRIFYDVDTFGGQSGAPVWIQESAASAPLAVGIHAYGIGGTPGTFGITANSAPRIISEVFDTIRGWIDEDGGLPAG